VRHYFSFQVSLHLGVLMGRIGSGSGQVMLFYYFS
jgi:hypothetical protein